MKLKKVIAAALIAGCIVGLLPANPLRAASLKIRYSGKTYTYTGKQLSFTYGTKNLSSSKYPGIQMSNVNMIPYYQYLVVQGPKVKRSYSKKTGKLVLKYGSKTLTAYIGKRTYYLNGKKKTFPKAPIKVTYYTTKKTVIMLPAKALITSLGMKYEYVSSANRIYINKPSTAALSTTTTTNKTTNNTSSAATNYNKTLSSYINLQLKQVSSYGGKKLTSSIYKTYINPASDTTHNYQFLRLNVYRSINSSTYNNLLNSKVKSTSVLKNKGSVLTSAAKTYKIDPVYFLCQTVLETGSGTSTLSQGKSITKVISGSSVVKDSNGNVTGFKKVNGKYITKTVSAKKVYNLYGIKAYDDDPQLCGFSYAYYMGWTSVDKAIQGAAKYVSQEYINNTTYKQNTLYKFRYNPNTTYLWHQYATDPAYAEKIASIMYSQYRSAYTSGNTFTYDKPVFK